jgi:MFS transporter, Spinster family, sphingosine-1-phosphate transporter
VVAYRNYLLGVLLVVLAFNQVDRLALGLVMQAIKNDLQLTDTQLGLLTGIAFALFYSVMGIPIARWADRGNRVTIISLATGLWSAAVALCAVATSFSQLVLIRTGVAIGEAGGVPPAHSLIADHFNRAERPRATAIYMLGASLSMVIGYFLAGWLNELYGWRTMFVVLGIPGVLLAAVAAFTLKEPRRAAGPVSAAHPRLMAVAWSLWANRTFRHLLLALAIVYLFGYGIQQWQPSFFVRSYGLKTGELGTWFTLIYGLGGVLGTYAGGAWASRRAAANEGLQLRAMVGLYVSFGFISALIYLSPHLHVALAFMTLTAIGGAAVGGPLFATIQTLVAERTRATAVALIYLFANLIGMGLGPLAAGMLSDAFQRLYGAESLRYSLLALCPGYFWGAWHLWRASRTVAGDLAKMPGTSSPTRARPRGPPRTPDRRSYDE